MCFRGPKQGFHAGKRFSITSIGEVRHGLLAPNRAELAFKVGTYTVVLLMALNLKQQQTTIQFIFITKLRLVAFPLIGTLRMVDLLI